jgi:diaminohydroxyphosphoribosylaminopyrimidine deaminase/5-amino-6-(5-phosphoribosylamino)uracil reductase
MEPEDDFRFMGRALRLAIRSMGLTAPNPGVGCVIAKDGALLGEGRHQVCGGPHGEVNALSDCRARGHATEGATAYVTLAPCTTTGRTPPCTTALIEAGISRVVVAVSDPNQDPAGPVLAAAGIACEFGCREDEARRLHGGFLTRVKHGRPRLTGKWATSLDGFIAAPGGVQSWVSSPEALSLSRRRRRVYDGILIGAGTAAIDDPALLSSADRSPLRIVCSAGASLGGAPAARRLLGGLDRAGLLVVHDRRAPSDRVISLRQAGAQTRAVDDCHDVHQIASTLADAGLNDVLVEGGSVIHGAFLRAGLYDRVEVFQGGVSLGGGLPVASGPGADTVSSGLRWRAEAAPRLLGPTVWSRWERVE